MRFEKPCWRRLGLSRLSRSTLQQWLLSDKNFRTAFRTLEEDAVRAQFPRLESLRSDFSPKPDWPYLIFCASILAPSESPEAEEVALRIAHTALVDGTTTNTTAKEKDAALIVLDTLSNRRAIELAEDRKFVRSNVHDRLGVAQSVDWLRRSFENRIDLDDGRILFVNKFQRRFWTAAENNAWLSVSAPTSAGKSFILAQWLAQNISTGRFQRIVYIAPTRALVQQVERDLRTLAGDAHFDGVGIRTIPFRSEGETSGQEILVFTQERLHYFIQAFPEEAIDALIVDEAHKLSDSHRGVLLQDVIERVSAANPKATVLFTAPLSDNPEALLSDAPSGARKDWLRSDNATVNQNLLWLQPRPDNPKHWELALRREHRSTPLGYFDLPKRLVSNKAKLATFALLCDPGEGGILVYASGAADAEKYAEAIAAQLPDQPMAPAVRALDELCDETIHKDYKLRAVLKKGVAFHYGNMPLLLRTAIEDIFRNGHIRYLVCTSTLIEGVNLPCRTIVIRAPKKGKLAMAPADFWNLAGRAGRWGKEFQGNVICIDTQDVDDWRESLPSSRGRYTVERTTDRLLNDQTRLLEYLEQGAPAYRAEKNQDLESVVSYFAEIRSKYGSLQAAPWRDRIAVEKLAIADAALDDALKDVAIPLEWIKKHAGISPIAMQRMVDALVNIKGPIDKFLPIRPEEADAAGQYGRIFEIIGHHMSTAFGQGGRCLALGILTTNWMLGYPIKRLISERISRERKKVPKPDIASLIRATLEDVEQIARFQAPRYLACYSDIARLALNRQGETHKALAIPDLTLSLEFGVRGPVQLGLMALGLSRSSTLAIAESVTKWLNPDGLEPSQFEAGSLMSALQSISVDEIDLPVLVREEVRAIQVTLGAAGVP